MDSPSRVSLEDAIHDYVAAATGLDGDKVLIGQGDIPSPNEPYATVIERKSDRHGTPSTRYSDNDDITKSNYEARQWSWASFSINFFRAGAHDLARALRSYEYNPAGQLILEQNSVVFQNMSDVRNLSAVQSGKFEQRAQVDLEVQFIEVSTVAVNSLDSAEITIEAGFETDITETLEVE